MNHSNKSYFDRKFKIFILELSYRINESLKISLLKAVLNEHSDKNIVIGTHGTALSSIIHYYDSSFGYEAFLEIKSVMPWIVQMDFNHDPFITMASFNIME